MQAVDISVANLFPKNAAYCFLAGSGISIDAPSNLPTGYQFTELLLKHILPHDYVNVILELADPHREKTKAKGHFIRFEQLMGFLQESVDVELHVLDCLAKSTQPNFNHLFLASLIEKGCPVFTTNFDGLIEYALIKLGVDKTHITSVIHRETWENEPIQGFPVYKLHGSLVDIKSGADTRSSIQATIEQIVRQKPGDTFVLEAWKMGRLQSALQERDLVVFGYSGLDDFDVIPALRSIRSEKRLIWVSHTDHIPVENTVIGCSSDELTKRRKDDHIADLFQTLESTNKRKKTALFDVRVNTRSLIEFLSQHWALTHIHERSFTSADSSHSSAGQFETLQIRDAHRWLLLGNVWYAFGDYKQALYAYKKSMSCEEKSNDLKLRSLTLDKMGTILETQGSLDEALGYLETALDIDRRQNDLHGTALRLNKVGFILYQQGKFPEAERHVKQALKMCDQIEYEAGKAANLSMLAYFLIAQNRTGDALQFCKGALAINERIGNISGKAVCLTSIGFIHKTRGDLDQAMDSYQQALEIREQMGDLLGKVTLLSNIGNLHSVSGRYTKAVEYFEWALALNEPLGDMNMMATLLGNMGNLSYRRGNLSEALKYYERSYAVFRDYGYEHQAYRVMEDIRFLKYEIMRWG